MIKVIVAIAGLALVEAPPNGPIDIHLPETEGFANVTPLMDKGKPGPFPMDDHDVVLEVGKGASSQLIGDPPPFRLTVELTGGAPPDLAASTSFPSLEKYVPSERSAVREECRFDTADGLATCVGRETSGNSKALLAGQVRLVGGWKLMAADTPENRREPGTPGAAGGHLVRLLVDDVRRATIHTSSPGGRFADTFLFVGDVEDLGEVAIAGTVGGQQVTLYEAPRAVCALVGGTACHLLWIESSPTCSRASCVQTGNFLASADTHFAQLYRLLVSYEPQQGLLADEVYVPFGHGHHAVFRGDGSPRCYGGIVTP